MATSITVLTAVSVLVLGGIAHADVIQDSIEGSGSIALVAGSATGGSATMRLNANGKGDSDIGCNIDAGESPLKLTVVAPPGVTATPNPVIITNCTDDFPVSFTAGSTAQSGTVTVTILAQPAGGGDFKNQVGIPITITQPIATNTAPSVTVGGVIAGASYEIGSVPTATCLVVDAEDANPTTASVTTGTLLNGLGSQTATCGYTDAGGLNAPMATVTYTVVDTVDPTIGYTLNPVVPDGTNGWYTTDAGVLVHFVCADVGGSGIATCPADITLTDGVNTVTGSATDNAGNTAEVTAAVVNIDTVDPAISSVLDPAAANAAGWYAANVSVGFSCLDTGSGIATCAGGTTLIEGENQSVTGTATDRAGNTAIASVSGINIDTTAPSVALLGGPTGNYQYGNDPAAPGCDATDALSGIASCVVTGGGTTVGDHSYLATATDKAGNTSTSRLAYTVQAWTLKGFYAPVDMGVNVWNTVKGGSTVPLKFDIFSDTELTTVSAVKSFTATAVTCPGASAVTEAIELTTTGGTSLRYDPTSGQFIQNWQTPKKPGTCAVVTMTAQDGSTISANFMLK